MKRNYRALHRVGVFGIGMILVLLLSPTIAQAQVTGQAIGVHATQEDSGGLVICLLGICIGDSSPTVTVLSDTGALSGPDDAREASLVDGDVSSLLTTNTLHSFSMSWADRAASEASVADLLVDLPGQLIGADFVRATAEAGSGSGKSGGTEISGLSINGVPIAVTDAANQTVSFPGGQIVINQQQVSSRTIQVVGLRITMDGVADIFVSATKAGF